MYAYYIAGSGFNSQQQRALRLLEKLDPTLCSTLPQKQFETGDYTWKDELMPGLVDKIEADVATWVITDPPFGYDEDDADDMALWQKRREAALLWVKSATAYKFAEWLYKQYAVMFEEATTNQGRTDVGKCLERYYALRRKAEQGHIRVTIAKLLAPVATGAGDVVDTFSFFVPVLLNAVFVFFGSQVRVRAPVKPQPRYKDREDKAKTYYLCGVVLNSINNLVKKKKNGDYLTALHHFEVAAEVAATDGLPTRHITLHTGGGLRFASKSYYQVFEIFEDRFFCRTTMNQTFALPNVNIIRHIKDGLLSDNALLEQFLSIMPCELDRIGRDLYPMFVQRVSTLHGTELANQLMEGLAAQKRRAGGEKKNPQENPKYESLRAARKKKKIELSRHKHVHDLTEHVIWTPPHNSQVRRQSDSDRRYWICD